MVYSRMDRFFRFRRLDHRNQYIFSLQKIESIEIIFLFHLIGTNFINKKKYFVIIKKSKFHDKNEY